MHILTDCDGVLLNWCESFHSWMKIIGHDLVNENEYNMGLAYNLDDDKIDSLMKGFCSSHRMRKLEPYNDSDVHYIRKLHREGHSFTVITATIDNPDVHEFRRENLHSVFGPDVFDDIIFSPFNGEKKNILKRFSGYRNILWVEDNHKNYLDGVYLGINSVIMDRPWNKRFSTRDRVYCWENIYRIVNSLDILQ